MKETTIQYKKMKQSRENKRLLEQVKTYAKGQAKANMNRDRRQAKRNDFLEYEEYYEYSF